MNKTQKIVLIFTFGVALISSLVFLFQKKNSRDDSLKNHFHPPDPTNHQSDPASQLSMVTGAGGGAIDNSASNNYLSIEESLLPLFEGRCRAGAGFPPMARINPGIRPFLRSYLKVRSEIRYAPWVSTEFMNCLWLFGFVCQAEDLEFVERIVNKLVSNNIDNIHGTFFNIPDYFGQFLGVAKKRNILGAKAMISKYANSLNWGGSGFDYATEDENLAFEQLSISFFSGVHLFTFSEYSEDFLLSYDGKHKSLVKAHLLSRFRKDGSYAHEPYFDQMIQNTFEGELEEELQSSVRKYDRNIKYIMSLPLESTKESLLQEVDIAGVEEMQQTQVTCEPFFEDPSFMPAEDVSLLDENSASFIEGICQEAVVQFDSISQKMLESKDPIELLPFLLDNQNTVSEKEIARLTADEDQRKEFAEDMRRTVEVVGIARENFREKMTNFRVEMRMRTIPIPYGENKFGEISAAEDIVVTFDLPGSGKMVKEKLGLDTARFDNATISGPDGDLRVYMRRINGKWYWNPFNW